MVVVEGVGFCVLLWWWFWVCGLLGFVGFLGLVEVFIVGIYEWVLGVGRRRRKKEESF